MFMQTGQISIALCGQSLLREKRPMWYTVIEIQHKSDNRHYVNGLKHLFLALSLNYSRHKFLFLCFFFIKFQWKKLLR